MDQIKVGKFIASCRKEKNLTQAALAEKLGITDRAVSKWETGKSMPDSGIMLELCDLLDINVNELLSGERIMAESYDKRVEENLVAMQREIEEKNRQLLNTEILFGVPAVLGGLVIFAVAAYLEMPVWCRALLFVFALAVILIFAFVAVGIEQKAGYYECQYCHDRHVPTYWQTNLAPHMGRTRYMKCPKCGKKSWQRKVLTKESDNMILETERLILRRWEESDAEDLYRYASDPDVGPIAGWPVHRSIEESREVIKSVLNGRETYAICLKEDGKTIGSIALKLNGYTDMTDRDDECELGYWLGKPFWGRGIMPEAVKEMLRHAYEDCGMQKVWIGYYEGNTKSKRVQEKCGFKYQWRSENVDVPLMHEKRTGHVSLMTKDDWLSGR